MARKPTGGKPGRPKTVPRGRDHIVFHVVQWVMRAEGLPLGTGEPVRDASGRNPTHAVSACVVAAWLLSGMRSYGGSLPDDLKWRLFYKAHQVESLIRHMRDPLGVPATTSFHLSPHQVRNCYRRIKAETIWHYSQPINTRGRERQEPYIEPDRDCHGPGGCVMHLGPGTGWRAPEIRCPALDDGESFRPQT